MANFARNTSQNYGEFKVVGTSQLPDDAGEVRLIQHSSGAEILQIDVPDKFSRFGIGFKTLPQDDSGASHALEHLVMKRDEHLRHNTAMLDAANEYLTLAHLGHLNAQTVSGFTMFEAAGIYSKDLRVVSDYLSRVTVLPDLRHDDYDREVARRIKSSSGHSFWNGVVLNEMRAANFSVISELNNLVYRLFYSGTPHQYHFGGSISGLKDLSLSKLKKLHATWYRRENCRLFVYGQHHLEETLQRSHEILNRFPGCDTQHEPDSLTKSRYCGEININLGISSLPESQAVIRHSWILKNLSPIEIFAIQSIILPYLTKKGLGDSASDKCRDNTLVVRSDIILDVPEPIVSIDVFGDNKLDPDQITAALLKELEAIAINGLPLKSSFERLSLEQLAWLENGADNTLGAELLERAVLDWSAGRSPLLGVTTRSYFTALRKDLRSGQNIIRRVASSIFCERENMLRINGKSTATKVKRPFILPPEVLQQNKKTVDDYAFDAEKEAVPDQFTSISEIVRNYEFPSVIAEEAPGEYSILRHHAKRRERQGSSTYVSLHRSFEYKDPNEVSLLSLASDLISDGEVDSDIACEIDSEVQVVGDKNNQANVILSLTTHFDGSSQKTIRQATRQLAELTPKWRSKIISSLFEAHLDLGESLRNPLENLDFMESRASALVSQYGKLEDAINGFTLYEVLDDLLRQHRTAPSNTIDRLINSITPLLRQTPESILVTTTGRSSKNLDIIRNTGAAQTLPILRAASKDFIAPTPEIWIIPGSVSSIAIAFDLRGYGLKDDGSVEVVQQIFNSRYIWELMREQFNCYGQDATYDEQSGVLTLSASCVADIPSSLYAFFSAGDHLSNFSCSRSMLDGIIRSTLSQLDLPSDIQSEHSEAWLHWYQGRDHNSWLQKRREIAATTQERIREIGEVIRDATQTAGLVISAPSNQLEHLAKQADFTILDRLIR